MMSLFYPPTLPKSHTSASFGSYTPPTPHRPQYIPMDLCFSLSTLGIPVQTNWDIKVF